MPGIRARGEEIRRFLLESVDEHPAKATKMAGEKFNISRQTVNAHLSRLRAEGVLSKTGKTSNKRYGLRVLKDWDKTYPLESGLTEDAAWDEVAPVVGELPANVLSIWNTGFTEMFNNALEHSAGTYASVRVRKTAINTEVAVFDDRVGIFRKIQQALNLPSERHAILELSKGKFTTDPSNHSGERIFFTSRMFDKFDIRSGELYFTHQSSKELDWLIEDDRTGNGTAVWMKLDNASTPNPADVYAKFSVDDYQFDKTVVPIKLAQFGSQRLVSRSQANRVLARISIFKVVILDFTGVVEIGQAFADEIFRVFAAAHPEVKLDVVGANLDITNMITRARGTRLADLMS
jgi:hypothetical protein